MLLAADVCGDGHSLRLLVPDQFVPGVPFLARVQVETATGEIDRTRWNDTVDLRSGNSSVALFHDPLTLYNGLGSVLVRADAPLPFDLTAQWGNCTIVDALSPTGEQPPQQVAGTLTGTETTWSGVVHVTDDVLVPADHTLTILPGTIVLIDGAPQAPQLQQGKHLRVQGRLVADGTETQPITITATDPAAPWGELHVDGGNVSLNYTSITRAGSSPRGGHTNTGPALRLSNRGELQLQQSNVTDISGKIMESVSGELTMHDTLLSRAVMGPEINNTSLDFQDSWIVDMAGRFHHNGTVDDNDGIYLHSQRDGQVIQLVRSVVAQVQDDGIDTLGSHVSVRDTIIRDVTDKGISVYNGETVVERSLLVRADIGIETKGSGSESVTTRIYQSTIANVNRAIRARNQGAASPNVQIHYDIRNSILHTVPDGDPIFTHYDPADLNVNYTWVAVPWDHAGSGEGNILGNPQFQDADANDYRLQIDSPAIDAGDPAWPLDTDGTRLDLGYLPRREGVLGDLDGDDVVGAADIDLFCAALGDGSNDARLDLNGDAAIDRNDVDFLLRDILQTTRGDANLDRVFNSRDLVQIFQAGLYEDTSGTRAGWAGGDWNCDGRFSTADLVAAFEEGGYRP